MEKNKPNNVDLEKEREPEAKTESETNGKMKVGLSEILGSLLALGISWLLATIVWQSGLNQAVAVAISVVEFLLVILAAIGIGKLKQIEDKYKAMAVLVACGCGLGIVLGYCTYPFIHIEIGPRNSSSPTFTQEATSVISTETSSNATPPTGPSPVEATPNKESEDKSITIDIPVDPITVTVAPNSDELLDKNILGDFCTLIGFDTEMPSPSAENKGFWKESLKIALWSLANTDVRPDNNALIFLLCTVIKCNPVLSPYQRSV